jgi:uncharacterized peroxidase-related enzyme
VLRSKFFTAEQVEAVVRDHRTAGLTGQEVAIVDFAVKMTDHAYKVTSRDIERLRSVGLSDEEIVEVAAAVAQRNFASRLYDALGAEPDEAFRQLEESLVQVLDVGGRWTGQESEKG